MFNRLVLPVGTRDHVQGYEHAPVTLVEYGDYQCSYCGAAYPIVKQLQSLYPAELRLVFRNFPLREVHARAQTAAEAAEAAGAQGRFWEMHDLLFENQADLSEAALVGYGRSVLEDPVRWLADLRRRAFRSRVQQDFLSGVQSGVTGTPTFYVNGIRHEGPFDLDSLAAAVEAARLNPPSVAGHAPGFS